jgi:DNA topoisomerase-1
MMATTKEQSDESDIHPSSEAIAREAGLTYVSDETPGYRRRRRGKGFSYHDVKGKLLSGTERERITDMAIPPAWSDVWISASAKGHIQATGRDEAGRKQYIYHEKWNEVRDRVKYGRIVSFAEALPDIRKRIDADLRKRSLSRERVLALVLNILDATGLRVGNREYAAKNGSYGVTTLRKKHASIEGSTLHLEFAGKSGVEQSVDIHDVRIVRAIRRYEEIPGYELFRYIDDDCERFTINANDVNDWLRETTGLPLTAKDFRTWRGTVLAARKLCEVFAQEECEESRVERMILEVVKEVAEELGNTPAVCREHYIHPAVLASCAEGSASRLLKAPRRRNRGMATWLSTDELRLYHFLTCIPL